MAQCTVGVGRGGPAGRRTACPPSGVLGSHPGPGSLGISQRRSPANVPSLEFRSRLPEQSQQKWAMWGAQHHLLWASWERGGPPRTGRVALAESAGSRASVTASVKWREGMRRERLNAWGLVFFFCFFLLCFPDLDPPGPWTEWEADVGGIVPAAHLLTHSASGASEDRAQGWRAHVGGASAV